MLTLPSSGQKIAKVILNNPQVVIDASSKEVAAMASVSQSSVIKFIQKIGYKSFTGFKVILSKELAVVASASVESTHLHSKIEANDSLNTVKKKLLREKIESIENTIQLIDLNDFEEVINSLHQANKIQIVGIGGSALVGKDLAYKLQKVGYIVLHDFDTHAQLVTSLTLKESDVQVVLSYSGENMEVNLCAETAQQKGAKVLALTSLASSTLRSFASKTLSTVADETQWRSSSIASRDAQLAIVDLIFIALLKKQGKQAENYISTAHRVVTQLKESKRQ